MLKTLKDKIIELNDKKDIIKKRKKEINILFRRVFPRYWKCLGCNTDNEEIISICYNCGIESATEKDLIDKEANETKDEIGIEPTEWQCNDCTLKNKSSDTVCSACGRTVDSFKPPFSPPGWKGSISEENLRKKLNDFTMASIIKPIKVDSKSVSVPIPGIENCGNSCYIAASLQAILSVPEVKSFFTSKNFLFDNVRQTYSQGYAGDFALVFSGIAHAHKINKYTLRIESSLRGPTSSINTLKNILSRNREGEGFASDQQKDSIDFMEHFLDGLYEDTKYTTASEGKDWKDVKFQTKRNITPRSPIRDLFGNVEVQRYRCSDNCVYTKDIRSFISVKRIKLLGNTLEECIKSSEQKRISLLTCYVCKKEGALYFKFLLEKPSNVLVWHIDRSVDLMKKDETPVSIPLVIESLKELKILANDKEPDVAYELNAVILHSGTRTSGHYIAIIRAPNKVDWIKCNDSRVSIFPDFEQSMETGIIDTFTVTTTVYVKIGIEWECPICTLKNKPTSTECSSGCGTKAPKI
jgi:ubiquitin C-terminal hydrolase